MKTVWHIITLILIFLNLGFAQGKNNHDVVKNLPFKDFKNINCGLNADVYLTQADSFSFQIEAKSKIIKLLEAEVVDGVLNIKLDRSSDVWDNFDKAIIHISAPIFEKLSFSGTGKIRSENRLTGQNISIRVSGASALLFKDTEFENMVLELSGVGNIDISGKTQTAKVELSGTGNIDVLDLVVQNASCNISGVGTLTCNVENDLDATVSGMGKIRYKSEPKSLKKSVSGLGKVNRY